MPGASISYCGKGNVTRHAVVQVFTRLKKAHAMPICIHQGVNQMVNFAWVSDVHRRLFPARFFLSVLEPK
jgi:hypothetical protein